MTSVEKLHKYPVMQLLNTFFYPLSYGIRTLQIKVNFIENSNHRFVWFRQAIFVSETMIAGSTLSEYKLNLLVFPLKIRVVIT